MMSLGATPPDRLGRPSSLLPYALPRRSSLQRQSFDETPHLFLLLSVTKLDRSRLTAVEQRTWTETGNYRPVKTLCTLHAGTAFPIFLVRCDVEYVPENGSMAPRHTNAGRHFHPQESLAVPRVVLYGALI